MPPREQASGLQTRPLAVTPRPVEGRDYGHRGPSSDLMCNNLMGILMGSARRLDGSWKAGLPDPSPSAGHLRATAVTSQPRLAPGGSSPVLDPRRPSVVPAPHCVAPGSGPSMLLCPRTGGVVGAHGLGRAALPSPRAAFTAPSGPVWPAAPKVIGMRFEARGDGAVVAVIRDRTAKRGSAGWTAAPPSASSDCCAA